LAATPKPCILDPTVLIGGMNVYITLCATRSANLEGGR
jgi:hypothetical protein